MINKNASSIFKDNVPGYNSDVEQEDPSQFYTDHIAKDISKGPVQGLQPINFDDKVMGGMKAKSFLAGKLPEMGGIQGYSNRLSTMLKHTPSNMNKISNVPKTNMSVERMLGPKSNKNKSNMLQGIPATNKVNNLNNSKISKNKGDIFNMFKSPKKSIDINTLMGKGTANSKASTKALKDKFNSLQTPTIAPAMNTTNSKVNSMFNNVKVGKGLTVNDKVRDALSFNNTNSGTTKKAQELFGKSKISMLSGKNKVGNSMAKINELLGNNVSTAQSKNKNVATGMRGTFDVNAMMGISKLRVGTADSKVKGIFGKIGNPEKIGTTRLAQQKGLSLFGDADGDGLANVLDCNPLDYFKQGNGHNPDDLIGGNSDENVKEYISLEELAPVETADSKFEEPLKIKTDYEHKGKLETIKDKGVEFLQDNPVTGFLQDKYRSVKQTSKDVYEKGVDLLTDNPVTRGIKDKAGAVKLVGTELSGLGMRTYDQEKPEEESTALDEENEGVPIAIEPDTFAEALPDMGNTQYSNTVDFTGGSGAIDTTNPDFNKDGKVDNKDSIDIKAKISSLFADMQTTPLDDKGKPIETRLDNARKKNIASTIKELRMMDESVQKREFDVRKYDEGQKEKKALAGGKEKLGFAQLELAKQKALAERQLAGRKMSMAEQKQRADLKGRSDKMFHSKIEKGGKLLGALVGSAGGRIQKDADLAIGMRKLGQVSGKGRSAALTGSLGADPYKMMQAVSARGPPAPYGTKVAESVGMSSGMLQPRVPYTGKVAESVGISRAQREPPISYIEKVTQTIGQKQGIADMIKARAAQQRGEVFRDGDGLAPEPSVTAVQMQQPVMQAPVQVMPQPVQVPTQVAQQAIAPQPSNLEMLQRIYAQQAQQPQRVQSVPGQPQVMQQPLNLDEKQYQEYMQESESKVGYRRGSYKKRPPAQRY